MRSHHENLFYRSLYGNYSDFSLVTNGKSYNEVRKKEEWIKLDMSSYKEYYFKNPTV